MAYQYIQQSDVENYLNIALEPDGVLQFNAMLPNMQDMVDTYLNRTYNFTNPCVEYFDALSTTGDILFNNYTFFPKYPPVSTTIYNALYPAAQGIISLTVGNSPLDMNYVFNYGTSIRIASAFPSALLNNPLGFKSIQVQYNSDAAQNVPLPVKQALIEWISRKISTSQDSNKDVKEAMTGNIRVYFAGDKVGGIPDFVRLVLDNFRMAPIDRF